MDEIHLLTRREAAARSRLGYSTLSRLLAAKQGPTVTQLGRRRLIREDHLREWIEQCANRGTEQA